MQTSPIHKSACPILQVFATWLNIAFCFCPSIPGSLWSEATVTVLFYKLVWTGASGYCWHKTVFRGKAKNSKGIYRAPAHLFFSVPQRRLGWPQQEVFLNNWSQSEYAERFQKGITSDNMKVRFREVTLVLTNAALLHLCWCKSLHTSEHYTLCVNTDCWYKNEKQNRLVICRMAGLIMFYLRSLFLLDIIGFASSIDSAHRFT